MGASVSSDLGCSGQRCAERGGCSGESVCEEEAVKKEYEHSGMERARSMLGGASMILGGPEEEKEGPTRRSFRASQTRQSRLSQLSILDDGRGAEGQNSGIMGFLSRVAPSMASHVSRIAPTLVSSVSRVNLSTWQPGRDDEDEESEDGEGKMFSVMTQPGEDWDASLTISRCERRRNRERLRVIHTLGREASTRMQLIIENPRRIQDFYELESTLGKGGFATVRRARVKVTGALRAVKSMIKAKMRTHMEILRKEIEITKMVDHPNIIKLYEIFEDETNLYLVMECCLGGHLQERLLKVGRFNEKVVAIIMQQVFRAVYYLHKNGIVHRDLKSENCLLSTKEPVERNSIKVADFGLACKFTLGQTMTVRAGTTSYMAPEVLNKKYNHGCDLWSCGVMTYCLLCGYLPFWGKDELDITEKILAIKYTFVARDWVDASDHASALVSSLLVRQIRRLDAKQCLQHPFIMDNTKQKDVAIEATLLRNLRTFRSQNKFKKAALQIVASQLKDEQLTAAIEAFMSADVDGDGTLSPLELEEKLRNDPRNDRSKSHVEAIFKEGDQMVEYTYTEFLAATFDRQRYCKKDVLKAAFSVFDQNGDGTLSREELMAGHMFGALSPEELHKLVEDLDDNGDGEIDFDEFMQMMRADNKFRPNTYVEMKIDDDSLSESGQESPSSNSARLKHIRKSIAARKAQQANELLKEAGLYVDRTASKESASSVQRGSEGSVVSARSDDDKLSVTSDCSVASRASSPPKNPSHAPKSKAAPKKAVAASAPKEEPKSPMPRPAQQVAAKASKAPPPKGKGASPAKEGAKPPAAPLASLSLKGPQAPPAPANNSPRAAAGPTPERAGKEASAVTKDGKGPPQRSASGGRRISPLAVPAGANGPPVNNKRGTPPPKGSAPRSPSAPRTPQSKEALRAGTFQEKGKAPGSSSTVSTASTANAVAASADKPKRRAEFKDGKAPAGKAKS